MEISFALGHELPFPPSRGGGVNSLLESLCHALAADGHEVTAYSPLGEGKPSRESSNGINHVRLKGAPRKKSNLFNALCGVPYALALRSALKQCDVLSCHMLHSFIFSGTKRARVVTQTLHRDPKFFLGVYQGLDRIYTGSEAVSQQARLAAPALAEKVQTIHNCVDFKGYTLPSANPGTVLRFIFVGRFSEDKGVETLIRAFAAAAHKDPNIQLSLVGPTEAKDGGDERLVEKCRAFIVSENLANRIAIEPPIFDRARLDERIRASDVVCLPSVRGETLNMSIIESMRLAKCLLISDLGANAPLVKTGINGLFAKTGDEADWTAQILHLAANRDKVAEFGVNSFHYGLETFSSTRIARDYVRDFGELIERSKR
jgi:glycosyltransferase involved in cell wall biosynthesis